ncbi:MAG: bifunctional biotin--[acetyl-CoA-carboxylase] ligase/biotin operon repressor BirA [Pseudomonadota bacterium]|nr:bifunctional biotin--[acetyl-CoA-carboxylase] ligase/biotin operon repressor BirA [Pseudomonadota bacterium]
MLTPSAERLIQRLADGELHSGDALARELGVTRAAVWKQLHQLKALGLSLESVRGQGYRLTDPISLLNPNDIRACLSPGARRDLAHLDIFPLIDSTNAYLLGLPPSDDIARARVCLAEYQSAGRGRRGRRWASPFGANIYLSLSWRFDDMPHDISTLSLACGVMTVRALQRCGASEISLKWPNDLVWHGRKLAGLLIEMRAEAAGRCDVVVGIGVNVTMPADAAKEIEQDWVDLKQVLGGAAPDRNVIAGHMLDELLTGLECFFERGFAPFREQWQALDMLSGQAVRIEHNGQWRDGVAEGIDAQGAIKVRHGTEVRHYLSGDVTLRTLT